MTAPPAAPCFVCGEELEAQRVALTGHSRLSAPTIRLHRQCAAHLAIEALLQFQGLHERHRPALRARAAAGWGITPAELRILQELAAGKTNEEIARRFGITQKAVKHRVSTILSKLGVQSRAQAAVVAIRNGIVE